MGAANTVQLNKVLDSKTNPQDLHQLYEEVPAEKAVGPLKDSSHIKFRLSQ